MEIRLQSIITCPSCGYKKEETMPTNACQYFYECENCKTRLKPLQGDCCVYCSYGTVKCPPIQAGQKCCWQTVNKVFREGVYCLKYSEYPTGRSVPLLTHDKYSVRWNLTRLSTISCGPAQYLAGIYPAISGRGREPFAPDTQHLFWILNSHILSFSYKIAIFVLHHVKPVRYPE